MRNLIAPSLAILVLAMPDIASAQSDSADSIDEIIVTAQKREQALEEIPQSIQLLNADMIAEYSLRDVSEVFAFIPGAAEGLAFAAGSRRYQIRGIYPAAGNNTVGFYLGDSPTEAYSGAAPLGRLYDMQQVEILRGPQSTLYGNGAMGGVVRYVPNQPDLREFDLGVRAAWSSTSGGDDGNYFDAFVSMPIVEDKFGIRIVGSFEGVGGFTENVAGDENLNDTDLTDLRVSALWRPNDRLSLSFLYADSKSEQEASILLSGLFPGGTIQDTGPDDYVDNGLEVLSATLEYDLGFADLVSTISDKRVVLRRTYYVRSAGCYNRCGRSIVGFRNIQ